MAAVRIDTFVFGTLETNCYMISCGRECWMVDPGMDSAPAAGNIIRRAGMELRRILLTHGHGDHIDGVGPLKDEFPGALLCCPAGDAAMLGDPVKNMSASVGLDITAPAADELLTHGQTLALGKSTWTVLDVSGHTPGGVAYYCAAEDVVLTGDALFAGTICRTDIPGASSAKLLSNIRRNLLCLPDRTVVLPGHGRQTTIGQEKKINPFLQPRG